MNCFAIRNRLRIFRCIIGKHKRTCVMVASGERVMVCVSCFKILGKGIPMVRRLFKRKSFVCNHSWLDGTSAFVKPLGNKHIFLKKCLLCGDPYIEPIQINTTT